MSTPPLQGNAAGGRTLWRDDAGGRFYLVPAGGDPGAGALLLRSGATRVLHADPAAVAAYEVTREEGLAFMATRMDEFIDGTQLAVESWLDRVAPREPRGGKTGEADAPTPASDEEHGPGVKFVASVVGETEEQLTASPEALLRGLGKLFESAAEAVSEARGGEAGREAVLARLRSLGASSRANTE
jgi:hypothetical protein